MAFDFAVADWEARLRDGRTPIPDLPLDTALAARALRIFDELRLPDEPGHPRLGDVAGEWIRDVIRAAFASRDPGTGLPLVQELMLLVPKKNAKTTYAAAMGLVALMLWDRPNAEMMVLGPTQSIAERCFGIMRAMIRLDPQMRRIFLVQDHMKTITRRVNGARLKVKTFDMNVVTGDIPALTIVDELHILGGKAGADRVIKQITGGMITNPRALVVYITTQSDLPPAGVFKAKLDYARKVRDGAITERVRMLPVLYEFPARMQSDPGQPWADPETWGMVLPNLGRSLRRELLLDRFEEARQEGVEGFNIWASQHLNIEIGLGLRGERWAGADHWAGCVEPGLDLEEMLDRSEVVTIGADWGGADDLASLAVIGRARQGKGWLHWSHSWARPSVLERRRSIATLLRDFERDGDLTIAETPDEQAEAAAAICARVRRSGLLPAESGIGLDAAGVALLLDALEDEGIGAPLVVSVPQGWKLQTAISSLPLKLEAGRFRHAGQPIMAWAVGNAKQELRGSNYMVTKQAAGAAKIDPLMATFNAAMLMFMNPVAKPRRSVAGMLSQPVMLT